MPNNINHVVVGNETKLDLREDTVTPSTMVNGIVAHDASGVRIVGTFDPSIFVQKSGDTMTGSLTFSASNTNAIQYAGTKATYPMIKFIDNTSDTYGNGIAIGGGGQAIIGGGESSNVMIAEAGTAGAESMWIGNDNDVNVYTNLQNGWSSKKTFTLKSDGGFNAEYLTEGTMNGGINALSEGTSPANRADYAVVQYAGGGSTTKTYHRRSLANVFAALNYTDITTALGWDSGEKVVRNRKDVRIKTTSNNNAKIAIATLLSFLVTNGYVPTGVATHTTIQVEFSYANNDILKFTNENGLVYETALAGALIEIEGKISTNIISANDSVFRLKIYAPPSDSGYTLDSGSTRLAANSVVLYTFNGTSYSPVAKIVDFADVIYTGNIGGTSGVNFATTLSSWFSGYKSKIPRNVGLSVYSTAYGNGTQGFGYFLNGYDSNPYGGFFMCHYNWPKYVGISAGTYTEHNIVTDKTSIGRTEFTPTYGSAGNPTKCWYAKYGKVVEVAMRVSGIAADSNNHQLYTLPSGYRPPTMISIQAHGVGTNGAAPGNITNEGIIIVKGIYSTVDIHAVFLTE